MSNDSGSTSGGIGSAGLLTITFVVLKLIGKISWSWWWVLSPAWISALLGLFMVIVIIAASSRRSTRPWLK